MNTAQLKAYAPAARTAFIAAVRQQAARFGVVEEGQPAATVHISGDIIMIDGQPHPIAVDAARHKLMARVKAHGFDATMKAIAYTWFNRFVALRYMELHNYFDHGYRVLSHPDADRGHPQVMDHIADLNLPELDLDLALDLQLDGTKDEELYRLILKAQCNALHAAMPFLFTRIGAAGTPGPMDAVELLLPANLLQTQSLIRRLIEAIDEEVWGEIEVVGWLYQYYISERKDQVIGKVVKTADIPAATQLFTPNWIVKYMVQNSLGAQWMATYPASPLKGAMDYYIEPAEQTPDVAAQLAAIIPDALNPEALTLMDPACGSGHILVEAYDLFKAIYLERGFRLRDIAPLILTKNLYGLDIDPRAAQLTGFALMMKGRADDRRLFEKGIALNVMALQDSEGFDAQALAGQVNLSASKLLPEDITDLKALFEHATTFGSLIQVPEGLAKALPALKALSETNSDDLFVQPLLKRLGPLVHQAERLAAQYDCVVANPPYMGSKFHIPVVKRFLKDQYPGYEKDVFSAFIDRNLTFSKDQGRLGFMTPFVWMFISSHEHMRTRLIERETFTTLIQLEYSGFEGATVPICTFTLQKGHIEDQKGSFVRLSDFKGAANQAPKTLEAIRNRDCGWFFEASQDEFKKIPGSPVAYWVSDRLRAVFDQATPLSTKAVFACGMTTGENSRFVRLWHEISDQKASYDVASTEAAIASGKKWFRYNKGGEFRKWFGNNSHVVNWENDGAEILGGGRAYPRARHSYFRESVTWSFISSSYFGVRYSPPGAIFDMAGCSAFVSEPEFTKTLCAFLCSKIVFEQLGAMNPTLNFQVGNVGALSWLNDQTRHVSNDLKQLAANAIERTRIDWNLFEHSRAFLITPLLTRDAAPGARLESSYSNWVAGNRETIAEMKRLEEENNRLFIDAYGLADELTPDVPIEQITLTVNPHYRYRGKLTNDERWTRFREDTMKELISYAMGCMMGRYSLDEPGLIYAHAGNIDFDAGRYATFPADDDGIVPLTDTAWFVDDACNRVVEFLSVAWDPSHLEDNLAFLAANLAPKKGEEPRSTLRRYLYQGFFKDHLKTYKKRPIYWLFSSGKKKAFQCVVYLHRYHEGTLARMRASYVIPLQGKMAARIEALTKDATDATSTAHRKALDKERTTLEKQQTELLAFDEKLRHAASLRIKIDLDDGVKVNYGKFGDLLADVKAVHGKNPEGL